MLQNAYFVAKIGADTEENEQHVAEIWACRDRRWLPGTRTGRAARFGSYRGVPHAVPREGGAGQ